MLFLFVHLKLTTNAFILYFETEYADDIYPYATFELNETRRESKVCNSIPTLDRRRSSGVGHWNPDTVVQLFNTLQGNNKLVFERYINYSEFYYFFQLMQEKNHSNSKLSRGPQRKDESDEYDSYGSDTDTERDLRPGINRLSIRKLPLTC